MRARWGSVGLRTIADAHGVSMTTVRKVAATADPVITSDHARARTKSAGESVRGTFAQQRAELAQLMIDITRKAVLELAAGSVVTGIDRHGHAVCERGAHLTARDRQALHTAIGISLDKHAMLDRYDSDTDRTDLALFLKALGGRGDS